MICLDIYDEGSKCYTPHNFLDFCGFECVNPCKDCKLWFTAIGVMIFVFGIMVGGALL